MNIKAIKKMQAAQGLSQMQELTTSGDAWEMEGSYGRAAMENLRSGACFLPSRKEHKGPGVIKDYWGNVVPFRDQLQAGTTGTLENSQRFWENFEEEPVYEGEFYDED